MPISTSRIEISESALQTNISFLQSLLGKDCILSSVVKGNAYGHGIETFVPLAQKSGVNHFSVFSANEAQRTLHSLPSKAEVMIMGFIDNHDLEWAIENNISFFVFDILRVQSALTAAKKTKKPARLHLEMDTGLNRTGLTKKELKDIVKIIQENSQHLIIEGICTHYAGAESIANHVRVNKQLRQFNKFYEWLTIHGVTPKQKHTACSAAAVSYPKTRMDMARIGIMQYGYWSSKETFIKYIGKDLNPIDPLKRVISWKSQVMTLHAVNRGEFVGYGTTFMAESDMVIAIIPVGYSQGYSRSLSNQGRILINGTRVSVVGVVNMNMLMVDVTQLQNIKIGDEAVLIGHQDDMEITLASFSELSTQLNYELLTRLPNDIPRIITE